MKQNPCKIIRKKIHEEYLSENLLWEKTDKDIKTFIAHILWLIFFQVWLCGTIQKSAQIFFVDFLSKILSRIFFLIFFHRFFFTYSFVDFLFNILLRILFFHWFSFKYGSVGPYKKIAQIFFADFHSNFVSRIFKKINFMRKNHFFFKF